VSWLSAYAPRTGSLPLAGIHCLSGENKGWQKKKRKLMKTAERKTKQQEHNADIRKAVREEEKNNERNEARSIIKKSKMNQTTTQESSPLAAYFNRHNYVSLAVLAAV
jgi:hypothetical protein